MEVSPPGCSRGYLPGFPGRSRHFQRLSSGQAQPRTRSNRTSHSIRRWRRIDEELSFFESQWKPNRWSERYRFVFIRKRVRRQNKMPIQLDLFVPHEEGYDFKVIVTNSACEQSEW